MPSFDRQNLRRPERSSPGQLTWEFLKKNSAKIKVERTVEDAGPYKTTKIVRVLSLGFMAAGTGLHSGTERWFFRKDNCEKGKFFAYFLTRK